MADIQFGYGGKTYATFQEALNHAIDIHLVNPIIQSKAVTNKEMMAFLQSVAVEVNSNFKRFERANRGQQTNMQRRTGQTQKHIFDSTETELKEVGKTDYAVFGMIGGPDYLIQNEYGGYIYPKGGKYMYMPLDAAQDDNGVPLRKDPRDWPNTFIRKTKNGNLMMFQRRGNKVVPLYLLLTRAYIKSRLGMRKAINNQASYFETKLLDSIERLFK